MCRSAEMGRACADLLVCWSGRGAELQSTMMRRRTEELARRRHRVADVVRRLVECHLPRRHLRRAGRLHGRRRRCRRGRRGAGGTDGADHLRRRVAAGRLAQLREHRRVRQRRRRPRAAVRREGRVALEVAALQLRGGGRRRRRRSRADARRRLGGERGGRGGADGGKLGLRVGRARSEDASEATEGGGASPRGSSRVEARCLRRAEGWAVCGGRGGA